MGKLAKQEEGLMKNQSAAAEGPQLAAERVQKLSGKTKAMQGVVKQDQEAMVKEDLKKDKSIRDGKTAGVAAKLDSLKAMKSSKAAAELETKKDAQQIDAAVLEEKAHSLSFDVKLANAVKAVNTATALLEKDNKRLTDAVGTVIDIKSNCKPQTSKKCKDQIDAAESESGKAKKAVGLKTTALNAAKKHLADLKTQQEKAQKALVKSEENLVASTNSSERNAKSNMTASESAKVRISDVIASTERKREKYKAIQAKAVSSEVVAKKEADNQPKTNVTQTSAFMEAQQKSLKEKANKVVSADEKISTVELKIEADKKASREAEQKLEKAKQEEEMASKKKTEQEREAKKVKTAIASDTVASQNVETAVKRAKPNASVVKKAVIEAEQKKEDTKVKEQASKHK